MPCIGLRLIVPRHPPGDIDPMNATKFVIDPSLRKYRCELGLFENYLAQLHEYIQSQENYEETAQSAHATIHLSIPTGGPAASAVLVVALHAKVFLPIPSPQLAPPPPPTPEPFVTLPPENKKDPSTMI